ncbi:MULTISPECIES: hypothetical protein [Acinetobacter]|uniref:Uncharacterized protein n=1 Tax=Acinetobacter variabilis TaxID=70346 RepID=A0A7T8AQE9_9GAMM|nr:MULTISPECIES: hypothetical protein [Acinetobacter]QQN87579.1 hypothetical protein IAQ69_12075 [Acinetobacter variabilis]
MQDLIEQLTQEQLVDIVILLEDDKKLDAIRYIRTHTALDESQAIQVIDEIVREHDLALNRDNKGNIGPRFTDDADENIPVVTTPLEVPEHPNLSIAKDTEVAAQQVGKRVPGREIEKKIWITAAVILLIIIVLWLLL